MKSQTELLNSDIYTEVATALRTSRTPDSRQFVTF